ncbi:NUDIX hydrolase [Mangrovibacter phragmitis]|jgi:ADP-ribose pyrophosphatase YjhB (NUDIX family)|uniref:NUDIX hydrolase n=1 Tax=Mangrovibacter phragmitis TaxID=1691903 RepID=A0A1B7L4Q4_9ENTR|nr:NUDIX domain-containing protein [Mangrovibacter phragmitis]OAT77255.1 NUDIX hydrolase [Mangrovibacter phragmitis]
MESEEQYLKNYDASRFPSPIVTVDSVLFTLHEKQLCVLLVKRSQHPFQGLWGLPGGFIDLQQDNSTQATATRKLAEKTGITPSWLEQLETFSGPNRDPRGWSITATWFALIAWEACQPHIATVSDVQWCPVANLESEALAFDHATIIASALQRLRQKTMYSLLPVYCLPDTFTQTQLQEATEAILGQPVQRKSLIRRFEASGMFEDTGQSVATGARKARLWRRKPNIPVHLFSRNLLPE